MGTVGGGQAPTPHVSADADRYTDRAGLCVYSAGVAHKWDEQVLQRKEQTVPMKKRTQHLIAEVPRKRGQVELTIGVDLGDVWSHYCTLNQQGDVIDRGR